MPSFLFHTSIYVLNFECSVEYRKRKIISFRLFVEIWFGNVVTYDIFVSSEFIFPKKNYPVAQ